MPQDVMLCPVTVMHAEPTFQGHGQSGVPESEAIAEVFQRGSQYGGWNQKGAVAPQI